MDEERRKARLANAPGVMGLYARQYQEMKDQEEQERESIPPLGPVKLEKVFQSRIDEKKAKEAEQAVKADPVVVNEEPPITEPAPTAAEFFKEELEVRSKPSPSSKSANNDFSAVELDPSLIDEWVLNDRPIDEFGDLSDLISRISQHGQEVPILVRPKKGGRYELIYGRRRWTACKELGRPVRAFVRKLTDQDAYQAMVSENESRQDISTWARALSYKKALDMGVYPSQAALAAHLGIDKATFSNIMIYTKIPDEIAQAVGSFANLGVLAVKSLIKLAEDKENIPHIISLADKITSGGLGARSLTKAVENARHGKSASDTASVTDENGSKMFSLRQTDRGVWTVSLAKDLTRDLSQEEIAARLKAAFK